MRRSRSKRRERRGFAILFVVLILALITSAIAISLDSASESTQNAGRLRAAEMVKSGLDDGVNQALEELRTRDPASLDVPLAYDIFNGPVNTPLLVPVRSYPPTGPYAGQYRVRIGLRPGQVTRPPVGEDVRTSSGQIYEVQVSVEARGAGSALGVAPSLERVSVGVLVPRKSAY